MSSAASGAPQNGVPTPATPGRAEPLRRVIDRRRIDRVWLPAYVVDEFGPVLKANGLAVYLALCQHATRSALACNPAIGTLAACVGVSRSTVERALRLLRSLRLIEVEETLTHRGQRTNVYVLTDPPHHREAGGAPGAHGGGAVPPTAPPRPIDGGAPSIGQGGAVPQTAPAVEPEDLNQSAGSAPASPTSAAAPEEEGRAPVDRVVLHWMGQLVNRSRRIRSAHEEEIRSEAAELLRRGWTAGQLLTSIDNPDRLRTEWPREWRSRLPLKAPRVVAGPPPRVREAAAAIRAAADAEAVAKARAELMAAGGIAALARRIGKSVPNGDDAPSS